MTFHPLSSGSALIHVCLTREAAQRKRYAELPGRNIDRLTYLWVEGVIPDPSDSK